VHIGRADVAFEAQQAIVAELIIVAEPTAARCGNPSEW
jgi:hypothetical protein